MRRQLPVDGRGGRWLPFLFALAIGLAGQALLAQAGSAQADGVAKPKPPKIASKQPPKSPQATQSSRNDPGALQAAPGGQATLQPTLPGAEATTAMPLKITLTPSETPLKIGSTSNIAATLANISSRPVRVELDMLQLTTHSIVAGSSSRCVMAMTPNFNASMGPEVTLQPQDQVTVLFNLSQDGRFGPPPAMPGGAPQLSPDAAKAQAAAAAADAKAAAQSCDAHWWGPMKRALDFSPGNYDYFLSGYFSLCLNPGDPNPDPTCLLPMRPLSVSATFPVGIDQASIILFSVVGGLLALLVVTFNSANKPGSIMHDFRSVATTSTGFQAFWQRLWTSEGVAVAGKFLVRAFGVAILSAAFTIVSSRLSDTQLPVKITILDAWGAMTIGFVSFFVGQRFIKALANWGDSGPAKDGGGSGGKALVRTQRITAISHSTAAEAVEVDKPRGDE